MVSFVCWLCWLCWLSGNVLIFICIQTTLGFFSLRSLLDAMRHHYLDCGFDCLCCCYGLGNDFNFADQDRFGQWWTTNLSHKASRTTNSATYFFITSTTIFATTTTTITTAPTTMTIITTRASAVALINYEKQATVSWPQQFWKSCRHQLKWL